MTCLVTMTTELWTHPKVVLWLWQAWRVALWPVTSMCSPKTDWGEARSLDGWKMKYMVIRTHEKTWTDKNGKKKRSKILLFSIREILTSSMKMLRSGPGGEHVIHISSCWVPRFGYIPYPSFSPRSPFRESTLPWHTVENEHRLMGYVWLSGTGAFIGKGRLWLWESGKPSLVLFFLLYTAAHRITKRQKLQIFSNPMHAGHWMAILIASQIKSRKQYISQSVSIALPLHGLRGPLFLSLDIQTWTYSNWK